MPDAVDSVYYAKRAAAEWQAAEDARDPASSVIHAKLAREYEARAAAAITDEQIHRATEASAARHD
ncbi:hypothetical protein P1X14_12360 [Sphingomonas sp. AOB5]|uniref:hypothetical protein n=1 Tax=Sphingomonas sp. AOB5 TaxID=3034017 RepID=UPI0023F88B30|nr:hypothetical protein [Sphingomonas sp. AOB5]MDF7776043.1 hypothetical protein [Sphingomonas sp. AOB5]